MVCPSCLRLLEQETWSQEPGDTGLWTPGKKDIIRQQGITSQLYAGKIFLTEKILQAVYSRDGDAAAVLPAARRGPEADRLVVSREHALYPHRLVRVLHSVTVMSRVTCPRATCPPA